MQLQSHQKSEAAEILQGQHVIVWPFAPGFYARDMLYRLWSIVEQDGEMDKLLHNSFALPSHDIVDCRGDLVSFIQQLSRPDIFLLVAQDRERDEIAAFFWLDSFAAINHRAHANVYVRKEFRGVAGLEASRIALRYCHEIIQVKNIWIQTPWEGAIAYAVRIGFERVARLPRFHLINGEEYDSHILVSRGVVNG